MLKINMEYRKGILFVRLEGELNKDTSFKIEEEIGKMLSEGGIKYLVFNIENLRSIDMEGINAMLKNNDIVCKNQGKAFVCGLKNELVKLRIVNSRLLNYMSETSNELGAFNIINL